ncbi:MAG: PAS domain S-box protein [candidate division Zixibacteria bacterium]|nr:PAS domain S-box protein [candidate division Zixibacteria bacterium]
MTKVKPEISSKNRLAEFSESFSSFSDMTQQLTAAYRELEQKYETLNTKLQETNIELRQSLGEKEKLSSYLNNILENLNSGVVVIDSEGCVCMFNQAAQRLLKTSENEVLGKYWAEFLNETNHVKGCLDTLSTGTVYAEEEKVIMNSEGSFLKIGFSTSLLKAPDGEIIGAVEVFYDLTKIKRLEKEMARVSTLAAMGEMAATIAHEVRNPLGAISGFTSLMDRDTADDDPRKKLIGKISSGIDSLNKIVNGLLDYTRDADIRRRKVNLNELMSDVVDYIRIEAEKNNITIKQDIDPNINSYPLDIDKFKRVLLNLGNNALQASPEGSEIRFRLHRFKSAIRVEVVDEGKGIEEQVMKRIFEPFFTTREKGTGLGLAIVKKLVDLHGGTIFVESGGLGKGARFVITLPDTNRDVNS